MAINEKIMDKIRALLEKTVENGASQEEAIAAAAAVQRLMAKYKIAEVSAKEPEAIDSTEMQCTRQWQLELAHILAKNLCCNTVWTVRNRKPYFVVMGKAQDRAVFQKMFETFFIHIYRGVQEEKRKAKETYGHSRDVELSYARGFIRAINEEMGQQCRALALVVPHEVNVATHQRFPHLGNASFRRICGTSATAEANRNGYSDGKIAAGQKRIA